MKNYCNKYNKNKYFIFTILCFVMSPYIFISYLHSYNIPTELGCMKFLHYQLAAPLIFLIARGIKIVFFTIMYLYLIYTVLLFIFKYSRIIIHNIFSILILSINIFISIYLSSLNNTVFSYEFVDALIFWNIFLSIDFIFPILLHIFFKTNKKRSN